jgi:DNA-binding NarL/FixJ family response regulator
VKKTVVIIDDHELMRKGLAGALSRSKLWQLAGEAPSLEKARLLFQNLAPPPALVLLDIELENKEWGLDLIPWLKNHYAASLQELPPVLIYSVYNDYAHIKTAFGMGALGYISKSEGWEKLSAALSAVSSGEPYIEPGMVLKITAASDMMSSLTRRDKQIAGLVQQGRDNRRIAAELGIGLRSVENYLYRIYSKLDLKDRKSLENL